MPRGIPKPETVAQKTTELNRRLRFVLGDEHPKAEIVSLPKEQKENFALPFELRYNDTTPNRRFPCYIDAEDYVTKLHVESTITKLEYIKSHFPLVETDGITPGDSTKHRQLALSWNQTSRFHLAMSPFYMGWVTTVDVELMYNRLKEVIEGRPYENDSNIDPLEMFKVCFTTGQEVEWLIDFTIKRVGKGFSGVGA